MIAWRPERLGHCVFLEPPTLALLRASGIPVEVCLECHRRCYAVPYGDNILARLPEQHVLGTDNPAFYRTSLSNEYQLAALHHGLSADQLVALARRAIDASFAPAGERVRMRRAFDAGVVVLRREFHI